MLFRIVLLPLILSMGFLLFPNCADSQDKEMPILEVGGKVRLDEGELNGATIEVYNSDDNKIEQQMDITETGKFDLQLSFQHNYQLVFKNNGSYHKTLIVNTIIPEKVLKRDPYFPPIKIIVTLFKVISEIDPTFSEKAVGKIFYSAKVDNFDSESYFNDMQIREKIDEEVAVSYQEKLDVAKTLEEDGNLAQAMDEYQRAVSLKQGDDSVKEKIASLEKKIEQEEQANQAEAARKDSIEKQVARNTSMATVDASDTALVTEPSIVKTASVNQTVANEKQSGVVVAKVNQVMAEQVHSEAREASGQGVKTQSDTDVTEAHKNTTQYAINGNENLTVAETARKETAQAKSSVAKKKSDRSAEASIKQHDNNSNSHILLFGSGLLLFMLLILLFLRRKAKQEHTAENE